MIDLGLSGFFELLYKIRPGGLTTPAYLGNRKKSHQGRAKQGRRSQRMRVSPLAAVNRRPVPQVAEYVGKRRNLSARRKRRLRIEAARHRRRYGGSWEGLEDWFAPEPASQA